MPSGQNSVLHRTWPCVENAQEVAPSVHSAAATGAGVTQIVADAVTVRRHSPQIVPAVGR